MKTINKLNKILILLIAFISVAVWNGLQAQVEVPFTQRTSHLSPPGQVIYNIKGDFQMIGNANLMRSPYSDGGNNSGYMAYVDIDGDPNTINSSSAELVFPLENDQVNHNCTNIIYAGLYWTGRAHNGTSPNTWTVGGTTNNRTNGNIFNGYTLTITAQNDSGTGDDRRLATYTFTPSNGGDVVIFRFRSWRTGSGWIWDPYTYHGSVTVQVGSGAVTDVPGSLTSTSDNDYTFTFTSPYTVNTGAETITINSLRKRRTNNTINTQFSASVTSGAKVMDKRKVKFKHANGNYTTITAKPEDIYYPTTSHGYMYAAYAEVTEIVQQYGTGNYFVADMALNEGQGGNTGFYGGWGLIVVYENNQMKWRDITIFDGYAYVIGGSAQHELTVSGFRTAQSGQIEMKLGIIAGEGDRSISGDYFEIQKLNTSSWERLYHDGHPAGVTNNFFNSSIPGTNPRNPSRLNNYGLDVAMFNINNTGNTIIGNDQTETKFRYGSTQDTYIISCIAMGVDAYIPELVPYIEVSSVNGSPYDPVSNYLIHPGEDIEYTLEIKNPGNERILNAEIDIPIPYTATLAGTPIAEYYHGTGTNPVVTTNGSINWNIGTIPMGSEVGDPADINKTLAKLTFKLKATTDCFLLVNENCVPKVLVVGSGSGYGETSHTSFSNVRLVLGYVQQGECQGDPITGPLGIQIDAGAWAQENCVGQELGIKEFKFCQNPGATTINFQQIASSYPTGTRFWSAYTTETIDSIDYVIPAPGATEYTATNNFPNTLGTNTYYAIPPGVTTCWWELKITVEICNLWMGSTGNTDPAIDTDWGTASNWTGNAVPGSGDNITFATVANYGTAAVSDLVLDINRIVGDVTNLTDKRLIIPAEKTLIINGKADTGVADKLVIKSEFNSGKTYNGALIFSDISKNTNVRATVEFASMSKPGEGTWPRVWQFFGVPVEHEILQNLFGSTVRGNIYEYDPQTNIVVRKYNEALNISGNPQEKWEDMSLTTEMLPYYGYEITQPTEGQKHSLKGSLVTEASKTLSFTISPAGVYSRGNYMLANPYAAPINIAQMSLNDFVNLDPSIYIYNTGSRQNWIDANGASQVGDQPGRYTTIPVSASPSIDKTQIPSLQAFLLRAESESAPATTFTFRYSTVQHTDVAKTNEPMRVKRVQADAGSSPNIKPLIKMDVLGENSSDRVYLITAEGTSKAYDPGWDGYKILNSGTAQLFAYTASNGRMQVNTDADLNDTYIGFRSGGESGYTIKFSFNDQMDGVYQSLYIQDLATGAIHEVADGAEFTFPSTAPGAVEKRFKLIANRVITDALAAEADGGLKLAADSKTIILNNSSGEDAVITIYDLVGKPIMSRTVPSGLQTLDHRLPQGTYVIEARIAGSGSRAVLKTIISK